jgi:hypothetical protein
MSAPILATRASPTGQKRAPAPVVADDSYGRRAVIRAGNAQRAVCRRSASAVCVVQNVEAIVSKRFEFRAMLGGTSPTARSAPRTRSR